MHDVVPILDDEQLRQLKDDSDTEIASAAMAALAGDESARTRCSELVYWRGR